MDIVIQGMGRIELIEVNEDRAYLRASVRTLNPTVRNEALAASEADTLRQKFLELLSRKGTAAGSVRTQLKLLASPIDIVFFVASRLPLDPHSQQELLQTLSVEEQIGRLISVLNLMGGARHN
jgi:Lon protease-like protein